MVVVQVNMHEGMQAGSNQTSSHGFPEVGPPEYPFGVACLLPSPSRLRRLVAKDLSPIRFAPEGVGKWANGIDMLLAPLQRSAAPY